MELSWLDNQDPWFVVLLLLVAMMVAAEIAFVLGRRLSVIAKQDSKGHLGTTLGSLLGLLALLLSFTFGMATQRYEARRLLMIDDANSVGTFYMRICLLPKPQRLQFMPTLRQYVDIRAQAIALSGNETEFNQAEDQSRTLLFKMWDVTRDMDQAAPAVKGADDATTALIGLIASHTRRLNALIDRVPDPIMWMLLGAAVAGIAVIGYAAGLGNHRGMPARIVLATLVCGTLYIILELDQPRRGLIRVDQSSMVRMAHIIDQDPDAQTTNP